jgi:hypothetical protein
VKAHLLYRDRDLELGHSPSSGAADLEQDLGLAAVYDAMARGDEYLRPLVESVLLRSLGEADEVRYRQDAMRDCLERPELVRELYALAVEAMGSRRQAHVMWFRDSPESLLSKSVRILTLLAGVLRHVRALADAHAAEFRSEAFTTLFAALQRDLDDEYLALVERHLRELGFPHGALIGAGLGRGNRGTGYVLREPHRRGLLERLTPGGPASHRFAVPPRDEAGLHALAELRGRGINVAANALAQATDHIVSFFALLRAELGFYVGCLNLQERLSELGEPLCFPEVAPRSLDARGLYDVALALHSGARVVGNDLEAGGARLLFVTGANEGGKSTFLRSVGLAQLMMQAGMFVAAESFHADVRSGVFTHFKREEDESMQQGKLDEELARMSRLVDELRSGALLLCNESFAATNEREGSEIARQLLRAVTEAGVTVVYVTHMFDLAESFHRDRLETSLFLRAERRDDGMRTYRVVPGEPLPTSFGQDSYRRVFGRAA